MTVDEAVQDVVARPHVCQDCGRAEDAWPVDPAIVQGPGGRIVVLCRACLTPAATSRAARKGGPPIV